MTPRNIQTFLPDGTLEGVRIVELSDGKTMDEVMRKGAA